MSMEKKVETMLKREDTLEDKRRKTNLYSNDIKNIQNNKNKFITFETVDDVNDK